MTAKTKSAKPSRETILGSYMDYVLEEERTPLSIYKLCKALKIEEAIFYEHFGSVAGIQRAVWDAFYQNAMSLLEKNKDFNSYSNREKMLSFFFTFFETLNLNRSYVLFALMEHRNMLKNMEQLKGLRRMFKDFATDLIEDGNADKQLKITQHNPKIFSEGAWLQMLFLLKFWMEDTSPGMEKTDLAIEKSVNTIFDLFNNTPLDSIIDFGKFLFKEKMA